MTATLPDVPDISARTSHPAPPPVDKLPIFFENGKNYLVGVDGGGFITMNVSDLRRHLTQLGFGTRANGAPLSEVEAAIHRVQMTKHVAYAGPLAGKSAGIHTVSGNRILVTGAPKIIQPDSSVPWPLIRQILEQMLAREDAAQLSHFYGWLKHAYVSLKDGVISQGQALALAGPRDCGKSLAQQLIREILGGREANPYSFMTGRTSFNRELFGAENLMFGDEVASTDYRNRVKFGGCIKQFVVNSGQHCHGKGREAVTLDPFWRVTMSLNDEACSLDVLPPLSQDSLADKIMLLKTCRPDVFDRPDWQGKTRPENWARLMQELPGFLAFLVSFEIPRDLVDTRLGVKAYQNPDLLVTIGAESAERRLLELIDTAGFYFAEDTRTTISPEKTPEREPWRGTATQLENRLSKSEAVSQQARRLLYYDAACGAYLASLAKKMPDRVGKLPLLHGLNRYEIRPPNPENSK